MTRERAIQELGNGLILRQSTIDEMEEFASSFGSTLPGDAFEEDQIRETLRELIRACLDRSGNETIQEQRIQDIQKGLVPELKAVISLLTK